MNVSISSLEDDAAFAALWAAATEMAETVRLGGGEAGGAGPGAPGFGGRLVLELTEHAPGTGRRLERVAGRLALVRALGARVAIDDLGSGYSSLARLLALPVDLVKLDRAALAAAARRPEALRLLQGLVGALAGAGLPAVVEGVEGLRDLRLARRLGAAYAQGFYLGRPEPVPASMPGRSS